MKPQYWIFFAFLAIALNAVSFGWQGLTVFRKRSGEGVARAWFITSLLLEIVNAIYGESRQDKVFIYNALICGVGQVFLLLALKNYKPWNWKEKTLGLASCAVLLAAVVLPFKNQVQMAAQGLNILGGLSLPQELKNSHGTGALSLVSLVLMWLSGGIWFAYCYYHYGFFGPALGYLGFTAWQSVVIIQWLVKHLPVGSS